MMRRIHPAVSLSLLLFLCLKRRGFISSSSFRGIARGCIDLWRKRRLAAILSFFAHETTTINKSLPFLSAIYAHVMFFLVDCKIIELPFLCKKGK